MARNETSRDRRARGVGRMVAILVLIGIAAANSALFYFIIWPEFSPHDPFSAILFFISGGAHLIYFFIPWFVVDVIGASFGTGGEDPSKYETNLGGDTSGFFMRLCTLVGVLSIAVDAQPAGRSVSRRRAAARRHHPGQLSLRGRRADDDRRPDDLQFRIATATAPRRRD